MKKIYIRNSQAMALLLFAALSLSVTVDAIARRDMPDDNLSYPVLFVSKPDPHSGKSTTGSGFYFRFGDSDYFVTAQHVLFKTSTQLAKELTNFPIPRYLSHRLSYDAESQMLTFIGVMTTKEKEDLLKTAPHPTELNKAIEQLWRDSQKLQLINAEATLFSYSILMNNSVSEIELKLAELYSDGNIKYHPSSDVAVIRLGTMQRIKDRPKTAQVSFNKGINVKQWAERGYLSSDNTKLFNEVLVSNAVYVFGYPTSITNQNAFLDIKLPLVRKGIVAGKNEELKLIILDCPLNNGNSGGLVTEVENVPSYVNFKAIGLITNIVPVSYDNRSINNSGYSVVVPMDRVMEVVNLFK